MSGERKDTPWYLWPFVALWELLAGIIKLTGRLVAAILGLVLTLLLPAAATLWAAKIAAPQVEIREEVER